MQSSRRAFLKGSALAMFGLGSAPMWLSRSVYGATEPSRRKKILVTVFQRGAVDGLNVVVPFGEKRYFDMRPTIAIQKPVDLDGFFGLHPSLSSLKPLYESRHLAIVDAVGSPDPTRSHFDAQDYMESGTPGYKATTDGWLNRALIIEQRPSPVRAVSMGTNLSRSLRGRNEAVAINSLNDFQLKDLNAAGKFQTRYADSVDTILHGAGKAAFDAIHLLQTIQKQSYEPANGAKYPNAAFGRSLQQIAQLIKSDAGLEVDFADIGGWDTHVNQVPQLANRLTEFGDSLAAFYQDLGDRMEDVMVVTMSEFGRTAKENGNRGTDHGHANVMFVLGGDVRGGKIYGDWPGLAEERLYEGRDLNVTTDFRDVLSELVVRHLGNQNLKAVFPGYNHPKFRNLIG